MRAQALDQQQAQEDAGVGRDTFSLQPQEYKQPLDPEREAEVRRALERGNVACARLAPQLRAFILEQLTVVRLGHATRKTIKDANVLAHAHP